MNRTINKKYFTTCAALLLLALWGCGSGEYEGRLNKRLEIMRTGSKFNVLSPPTSVPDSPVSIRIPQLNENNKSAFGDPPATKGFDTPPLTEGAMIDGRPVDLRRVKPNVVNMVDLRATYEGYILDRDKGRQHYYLYVAVSSGEIKANIPRNLQSELSQKFNNATQLEDNFDAPTPEGRGIKWKHCRASGNQIFYYFQNNEGQFPTMQGVVEMFFHEENGQLITLIWRYPSGVEQTIEPWTKLVAGCVQVQ
jgi:hypothetical protein